MNVQDQIAALTASKTLDLTAVHAELVKLFTKTNEKMNAIKEAIKVKKVSGYPTSDDICLMRKIEENANNKARSLVFGAFISVYGKPRTSSADLFFSLSEDE